MRKMVWGVVMIVAARFLVGCIYDSHRISQLAPPTPVPGGHSDRLSDTAQGPLLIASYEWKKPTPAATPTPPPISPRMVPTPVPGYVPGRGGAVLFGPGPYEITINPGDWQGYWIGPSALQQGYLVDVTPLEPSVSGAYVEAKILPEYYIDQWIDELWIRAPGIQDALPVRLDLIPTTGWRTAWQADVRLNPGDWMGFGMFPNAEGCGGVLDITVTGTSSQEAGSYIQNTRVQPEFPKPVWVQVARVQLSTVSLPVQAQLKYYSPGALAEEVLREEVTLEPGWTGWTITGSQALQGYVVEVVPIETTDNEVAASVVRPEFDGTGWQDVLRLNVPENRPRLDALVRVLAVGLEK